MSDALTASSTALMESTPCLLLKEVHGAKAPTTDVEAARADIANNRRIILSVVIAPSC